MINVFILPKSYTTLIEMDSGVHMTKRRDLKATGYDFQQSEL